MSISQLSLPRSRERADATADRFSRLESPICDLRWMADLAADAAEDALNGQPPTKDDAEKLLFAVYHLRKMILDLRQDYREGATSR